MFGLEPSGIVGTNTASPFHRSIGFEEFWTSVICFSKLAKALEENSFKPFPLPQ